MNYIGTSGPDNLAGTSAADFISGLEGDDNIVGNGGQDSLYGGKGNDNITFGPTQGPGATTLDLSPSIIYGGLGNDVITSLFDPAFLLGTASLGFNTVYGGTGDPTKDSLDGSNDIDLSVDTNADFVFAGGGGDLVTLGAGSGSSVTGGAGNDTVDASEGSNVKVNANMGSDFIIGSDGGGDLLHGGMGNDTIEVTGDVGSTIAADKQDDVITATGSGNNKLYGGMGNDSISIGSADSADGQVGIANASFDTTGRNSVLGGFGADTINVSGQANNSIYGGTDTTGTAADSGNLIDAAGFAVQTRVYGNVADNGLGGAGGNDLLVGGGGSDTIVASDYSDPGINGLKTISVDTLTGGGGNDAFVFGQSDGSQGYNNVNAITGRDVDLVTDFVSGVDQFAFGNNTNSTNGDYIRGDDSAAQIAVNNAINQPGGATLDQAADAAIQGGEAGFNNPDDGAGNFGNSFIFSYQNSNYLVVDATFGGRYNEGDYLIGIGSTANLTNRDING